MCEGGLRLDWCGVVCWTLLGLDLWWMRGGSGLIACGCGVWLYYDLVAWVCQFHVGWYNITFEGWG